MQIVISKYLLCLSN